MASQQHLALDGEENEIDPQQCVGSASSLSSAVSPASTFLPLPPMPALPSVFCADDETFKALLVQISAWQLLAANWISDLRSTRSCWTGKLPANYGAVNRTALCWADAKATFINPKGRKVSKTQQKQARDLLVRVLWFVNLDLSLELVGEKMAITQLKHALLVKTDGPGAVLVRVMYWVMARMRDVEFEALDRNDVPRRQDFWFGQLDAVAMFWILAYMRDAIDFEWLFDAAGLLNASNTGPTFKSRLYTAESRQMAGDILYMIKMRLVYAADVVFVYMIDGQREPFKATKFPANNKKIAAIAETWKQCVDVFDTRTNYFGQRIYVALERWPVRVGYDENVAMYETKFMAEAV